MNKTTKELSANSSLSHYRIVSKIGAGRMGEVYLAEDLKLGRRVALKVLPQELTENPDYLRRFEREARAASALNHPNILTVYEIGDADGAHFIATEFIEGESLRQRINRGPMELPEVLDIGIQIASAVAAAHETGIVHRHIKPENIMLRKDRLIKVLDFGLAKLVKQEAPEPNSEGVTKALLKTKPGVVRGTTIYMSPEQTRGREVDESTDIRSLGVVLYQMVTGNAPFAGDTMSDVIASILKTDPQPLVHETQAVPRELEHIVSKALRKNRDERYQHMKDLQIDLKDCKQELEFATKLERSLPPGQTGKQVLWQTASAAAVETRSVTDIHTSSSAEYRVSEIKRHKLGATAILVILMAFVAFGFLAYWRYFAHGEKQELDSLAVLPFTCLGSLTSRDTNAPCQSGTLVVAFPFLPQGRHPEPDSFRGSIPSLHLPPVNASPNGSLHATHDSGPLWLARPLTFETFIQYNLPVYPGAQENQS